MRYMLAAISTIALVAASLAQAPAAPAVIDRKSTRLNSSHSQISYAVFCLKKKKKSITMSRLFYKIYMLVIFLVLIAQSFQVLRICYSVGYARTFTSSTSCDLNNVLVVNL